MGMKRNTIRLVIQNKIDKWLDSIDDKALVQKIRRNIIVSGGCITSMLSGEKVNDYDVYFTALDVAESVALYYSRQYAALPENVEEAAKGWMPEVRRETRPNIKGVDEERVMISIKSAGVAGEDSSNFEIPQEFQEHEAEMIATGITDIEELADKLSRTKKPSYRPVFFSENAITLSDKIQLIIRFAGTPEEIHKNFDYLHCTCYYETKQQKLVLPPEALESIMSKSLMYNGSMYPLASLFRIRKFIKRGWRITAGQMLKIIWQLNEVDLTDKAILREQLIGVDLTYMYELINELANTKEHIDSTYVATLVDRIFEY